MRTRRLITIRRSGYDPSFLESDRSPGIYREFIENRLALDDGTEQLLSCKSPNVDDPDPTHGRYETGRRFQLFDVVTLEFLLDIGMAHRDIVNGRNYGIIPSVWQGIHTIVDRSTHTVYRFRIV